MSAVGAFVRTVTLWPTKSNLNEKIGCWGEIGRVIHWVGAAFASNFLLVGLTSGLWDPQSDVGATFVFCTITALILYLPARGLRRLMAGE